MTNKDKNNIIRKVGKIMGQRSQIYVRYNKDGINYLTARHYGWNYGERMISRCRHTIEWIKEYLEYDWHLSTDTEKLKRILDVNFDMKDVVLGQDIVQDYYTHFKEFDKFNDFVFRMQHNNDGKLFIDVKEDTIKYAFLDYDCDTDNVMDAEQYMDWDIENWRQNKYIDDEQKSLCESNLKEIADIASLMTKEEVEDFINCDYISDIK